MKPIVTVPRRSATRRLSSERKRERRERWTAREEWAAAQVTETNAATGIETRPAPATARDARDAKASGLESIYPARRRGAVRVSE